MTKGASYWKRNLALEKHMQMIESQKRTIKSMDLRSSPESHILTLKTLAQLAPLTQQQAASREKG
jgi:hypothetical protein